MVHQPGVNVSKHLAVQAMRRGIRLKGHPQTTGTQSGHFPTDIREWMFGVPGSMNNQKRKLTARLHSPQRSKTRGQPAVDRDHAGKPIGITQAEAVSDGGTFSAADKEDPF